MPLNTDKTSIHAQLRPPSKSLGGHFFFNLWHKLGTDSNRCHMSGATGILSPVVPKLRNMKSSKTGPGDSTLIGGSYGRFSLGELYMVNS